jgi:hypothetical protein
MSRVVDLTAARLRRRPVLVRFAGRTWRVTRPALARWLLDFRARWACYQALCRRAFAFFA